LRSPNGRTEAASCLVHLSNELISLIIRPSADDDISDGHQHPQPKTEEKQALQGIPCRQKVLKEMNTYLYCF